ncbi:hypothetical protein LY90DRAFT_631127 [Neocallimastix californiae]|uniref:Uncharacterized protein n=1 Tax=Neocallimastix californiae TaxID=1754190 RepID=A0A1Y2ALC0_9FUNG|nr:hypothetical protein LY90DRAFT_631127 [Neocallimastix californiae]|eukprot:ORY23294.1 hypothetical protein LY90DRAFT_631127 [Neocallimastix californiae]
MEGHLNFEKISLKVKEQIKDKISETQSKQLERALNIMNYFPKDNIEFRSCWYWIIPCMKYGSLIMNYLDKKMIINMCSSGVYFFRHQDKNDKKLEGDELGIENRNQVAIKILEHLSGKKDIVATATTAGTTTDKNEKMTATDLKIIINKDSDANDLSNNNNKNLNNKSSKNELLLNNNNNNISNNSNNKLKKKNSKVFIRNNINDSTMENPNDKMISDKKKSNKMLYMNNSNSDNINNNNNEIKGI